MANIRFVALPMLLADMERDGWIIDTFPFRHNNEDYIVVFKRYLPDQRKPTPHAVASLEFCRAEDLSDSIRAYMDFWTVRFRSSKEFCRFFGVKDMHAGRALFADFAVQFSGYIPTERNRKPTQSQKQAMSRRLDGNNPNAMYCYALMRNGLNSYGEQKHRTIENDNKAQLRCPGLYEKFGEDRTLSFCFTDDPAKERSAEDIARDYTGRQ